MKFILVQDVCNCEDYPCCGHIKDPYALDEHEARRLEKKGEVTLLGYFNPETCVLTPLGTGTWIDDVHSVETEKFIKFALEHPAPIKYESKEYKALERLTFDLIDGMEYNEADVLACEIQEIASMNPKFKECADLLYDIVQECDWSDDYLY